ncbi:hypothetical protein Dsin_019725 [Dipteronia sinensis]|uniref:Uncharacterized protein n=1 Tax=Dipteronia sinensis TaxID=43782 RepID=A0AAE0E4A6_9ROSI|nr:hypothetical protein Dsin_019725 [Dipteronia sinensis]
MENEITTKVLGVCSKDMQFIYVLQGWKSSAHDGKALRDAVTGRNGLKVPQDNNKREMSIDPIEQEFDNTLVEDDTIVDNENDYISSIESSTDDEEELQQDDTTDHENVESFKDLLDKNIGDRNMEFQSQGTEDFEISSSQPPNAQCLKSTDNNVAVSKRARTIINKTTNEMHTNFSNMASAIAAMAPKLDGLINVLSYEKEVADLHAKLKSELNNMEGLSRLQLLRATNMLAKDHGMLWVFFTMSAEEKKIYVMDLLGHVM